MNEFKIKRNKERNFLWFINLLKCFIFAFGALMIISISTGGQLLTFKHVIIYTVYSIPLCILYAYTVEKVGSGFGGFLSGWGSTRIRPREALSADLERARYSKRNGRFEEALLIINEVLTKDPGFPDALYLKGQIMWEGFQNGGDALLCFKKVMGLVQNTDPLHTWSLHYYDKIKATTTSLEKVGKIN